MPLSPPPPPSSPGTAESVICAVSELVYERRGLHISTVVLLRIIPPCVPLCPPLSKCLFAGNIFYQFEYREFVYILLKKFNPAYQSTQYVNDLVLATHVYLSLLEEHAKGSGIVVQKKRRVKKRKGEGGVTSFP